MLFSSIVWHTGESMETLFGPPGVLVAWVTNKAGLIGNALISFSHVSQPDWSGACDVTPDIGENGNEWRLLDELDDAGNLNFNGAAWNEFIQIF